MDSISISRSNTENAVSEIINKIETEVIGASAVSGDMVINAVVNSAGDFIESLKEQVAREKEIISSVGELMIAMAEYIQSAAAAFANVDDTYNNSKV